MRTVGTVLKEARVNLGWSIDKISRDTKIKEKFLIALEESRWVSLPNFSVASGFVRSYAQTVGVEPNVTLALLRRDFPESPKEFEKQEISLSGRPIWTPRATLITAISLSLLIIFGYLIRQYLLFVAPPPLEVQITPSETQLLISGKTAPTATLEVNRHPVLLEKDGTFRFEIDKSDLGEKIEIKATSRSGKSKTIEKPVD